MSVNVDRSLKLPKSEYLPELVAKSGMTLHHTVCDDAHTTVRLWRADNTAGGKPRRLATLQDYILRLEAAEAAAYETCYQAAYGVYQDLSRHYMTGLRKPSIRLGPALGILGAAGLGVLVGRAIP